jgi:hypothetical protein
LIAWVIDVTAGRGRTGRRQARPTGSDRLDAVAIEVGHGEAMILATVRSDGRILLRFGSGQEFSGCCRDLPVRIGSAARRLLDVAEPLAATLSPADAGAEPSVRVELYGKKASHVGHANIVELTAGRSPLSPVWAAFSELLAPLIVVLFGRPGAGAERNIPGLTRARRLWAQE